MTTSGKPLTDTLLQSLSLTCACARALAELLGQVKPPVASKEDIEKSGLEVIKATQLPEYTKNSKIAENTVDRVSTLSQIFTTLVVDSGPSA